MLKMYRLLWVLFFITFSLFCTIVKGQDLLRNYNLRQINVDRLSDDEILKFQQQLKANGVSQTTAEQIAIARGMPASEVEKLRQRILQLNTNANGQNNLLNQQAPSKDQINRSDTTVSKDTL